MSQASIVVSNGTGAQVRAALNNALQALATGYSGDTAPGVTYPFMIWIDTSTTPDTWKMRNAANSGWLTIGTIDTVIKIANAVNADTVGGYTPGNASGNVPVSNGTLCTNLNAQKLNGQLGTYYAPIASPTFTGAPAAPTPATNDSTTKIATTAFVNPAASLAANGYQKLASGLIIQWGSGGTTAIDTSQTFTLPIAFPTACLVALVSVKEGSANLDDHWTVISNTLTTITIQHRSYYSGSPDSIPYVIAIGY